MQVFSNQIVNFDPAVYVGFPRILRIPLEFLAKSLDGLPVLQNSQIVEISALQFVE